MDSLNSLADRCEAAPGPDKALDREIALSVGWVRQSPSEARSKHPRWFHPDDCRDGKVIFDSLHGTDVWRHPSAYTASLDAAITLYVTVPKRIPSNPRLASAEALRQRAEAA